MEAPTNAQGKLALAQYLTYCDGTRREGNFAACPDRHPMHPSGATALESWRQALAWVESDVESRALRLVPICACARQDRQVRAQLGNTRKRWLAGRQPHRYARTCCAGASTAAVTPCKFTANKQPLPIGKQAYEATNFELLMSLHACRHPYGLQQRNLKDKHKSHRLGIRHQRQQHLLHCPAACKGKYKRYVPIFRTSSSNVGLNFLEHLSTYPAGRKWHEPTGGYGGAYRAETGRWRRQTSAAPDSGFATCRQPSQHPRCTQPFWSRPVNAWQEPLTSAGAQSTGLGLGMAYEGRNWQVDVGTTPLGVLEKRASAQVFATARQ